MAPYVLCWTGAFNFQAGRPAGIRVDPSPDSAQLPPLVQEQREEGRRRQWPTVVGRWWGEGQEAQGAAGWAPHENKQHPCPHSC